MVSPFTRLGHVVMTTTIRQSAEEVFDSAEEGVGACSALFWQRMLDAEQQ